MGVDRTDSLPLRESPGGVLTVSAFTALVKGCLERTFRLVRVEGEISNHRLYPSGHRYFSLKDEGAQVRVVLFRGRDALIGGELKDGQTVIVTGSLGVYEKRGEYQLYARAVEVKGLGSLLLELERRKAALAAEGLFDPARKRPLPPCPRRIGIVTSREGAALRDMVRIARRRWPAVGIVLAPALVQGDGAAADIARAIAVLAVPERVDLLIVGRGGGSVEDLWAFNEEVVVRAIAASPVPTISAVGHETDFTLADLAADHRAPTPTAAAQMAVPDRLEMTDRVGGLVRCARKAVEYARDTARRELRIAASALSDPRPLLQARRFAAAERAETLAECVRGFLRARKDESIRLATAVRLRTPDAWIGRRRGELAVLSERALRQVQAAREGRRSALNLAAGTLGALDPRSVLARGYAIASRADTGRPVRSVAEVAPGDRLDIRVSDGSFSAAVREKKP